MKSINIYLLILLIAFISSCGKNGSKGLIPKSGGNPYEVLIISPNKEFREVIHDVLSQKDNSLPQEEPLFDVSIQEDAELNQITKMARNIVIITKERESYPSTTIKYEKDHWAQPQMVIYISTPSIIDLKRDMRRLSRFLIDLLTRQEMNNEISILNGSNNKEACKEVEKMFGWNIEIPSEMKSLKKGKDFLWFSNNASKGMRNLCIYSFMGDSLNPERIQQVRDSVMKENIPGEQPQMYMETSSESVTSRMSIEKNGTILLSRGLWEMKNDAMGGPFVLHAMIDSLKHKVIVAEAFIYAPEGKKRNLIRKDEAALYTLKKETSSAKSSNQ